MTDSNSRASAHSLPGQGADSYASFLVSQGVTIGVAVSLLLSGWTLFALFGVGPALGFQTFQETKPPLRKPPKTTPDDPKPTPDVPKVDPLLKVPQVKPVDLAETYVIREQSVLRQLQRSEFEYRTAKLQALLKTIEQRLQNHERRVLSLRQSDEGRRLAQVARQIRYLLSQTDSKDTDLQELRTDLNQLHDRFAQATGPLTDLVPFDRSLLAAETKLQSLKTSLDLFDSALDELLAVAPANTTGPTLNEALMDLNVSIDDEVRRAVSAKEKELKEHQADKLKEANKHLDSLQSQLETVNGEFRQAKIDSDNQTTAAKGERAGQQRQLEENRKAAREHMEKAFPEFRARLSPFISKGYRQVQTRQQFVKVIEAQPIAYSGLLRVGALNDTPEGLETLLLLSDNHQFHEMNDRPTGAFPKYTSEFDIKKPDVLRELKAIQAFLREHGEAMVEAKLLAP